MFEKFTEKAINVVSEAQRFAKELKCSEVYPEHVLLALVSEARGVSLKLFRMFDMTTDEVLSEVAKHSITTSKTPGANSSQVSFEKTSTFNTTPPHP